jgi:hypothetical protein
MNAQVGRQDFMDGFAPFIPVLEDVIQDARSASSYARIAKAIPEIARPSGIARLSGTARWILVADGLVDRVADFPEGFCLHSTDANHNQGKYIFGFPLGVFTVKREPHEENKGLYLQESLQLLKGQEPLAPDVDAFADLKVYVSVPAKDVAGLIVERPDAEPMTFLLDEFDRADRVVASQASPMNSAVVRSSRSAGSEEEDGAQKD